MSKVIVLSANGALLPVGEEAKQKAWAGLYSRPKMRERREAMQRRCDLREPGIDRVTMVMAARRTKDRNHPKVIADLKRFDELVQAAVLSKPFPEGLCEALRSARRKGARLYLFSTAKLESLEVTLAGMKDKYGDDVSPLFELLLGGPTTPAENIGCIIDHSGTEAQNIYFFGSRDADRALAQQFDLQFVQLDAPGGSGLVLKLNEMLN